MSAADLEEGAEQSFEDAFPLGEDDPEEGSADEPELELAEEGGEEADEPTAEDEDPEEEWTSGDKAYKVKKSELRARFEKTDDSTQKWVKASETMKAAQDLAARVNQERSEKLTQVDAFLKILHADLLGSQPDGRLIDENPQEYLRQQAAHNARVQQFQTALGQRQAMSQQQDVATTEQQLLRTKAENEQLEAKVPEWRNPKTKAAEHTKMQEYLIGQGFTPKELDGWTDHRALLVARDAAKYREMKGLSAKKTTAVPPKPVRPGAAQPTGSKNNVVANAKQRLRANSSDERALIGLLGASNW